MTILGSVHADLIPFAPLTLITDTGSTEIVEAVVDTGFNGYVTLSADHIQRLGLTFMGTSLRILGDGRMVEADLYIARILWQGQEVIVQADEAESGPPLIGMQLLLGNLLTMDVRLNGLIEITEQP